MSNLASDPLAGSPDGCGEEVARADCPPRSPDKLLVGILEEVMRRISEARTEVDVALLYGNPISINRAKGKEFALSDFHIWLVARENESSGVLALEREGRANDRSQRQNPPE